MDSLIQNECSSAQACAPYRLVLTSAPEVHHYIPEHVRHHWLASIPRQSARCRSWGGPAGHRNKQRYNSNSSLGGHGRTSARYKGTGVSLRQRYPCALQYQLSGGV